MSRAWPPGAATGIGSLPGLDIDAALRMVFDELPDLPFVPELPDRGPGAQMIGRSASLFVDLPVEIAPTGWRFTAHDGRDVRRSRDLLSRDLDALEQVAGQYSGSMKIQVTGPWTLAAGIELASGHAAISDAGATRELAQSLIEGLIAHLADVQARVPGSRLIVQVDEPMLPAVLAGRIPTPSGYGTVRATPAPLAAQTLRELLAHLPAGGRVLHCCAAEVPIELLREAGADALSVDAITLPSVAYDQLGEALDAGTSLWLGVVDSRAGEPHRARAREHLDRLIAALGMPAERRAESLVPTPSCGLAASTDQDARAALRVVREIGQDLLQEAG